MTANPIGLVIVAIVALIAGFVLLWTKCDGFRQFFLDMAAALATAWGTAWDAIKAAASAVLTWVRSTVDAVGQFVSGIWDDISSAARTAWDAIKGIVSPVIDGIRSALEALGRIGASIWNGMKSAVDAVKRAIDAVIAAIRTALTWASNLASKIPFIGGFFGGQSAAPAGARYTAAAPSLARLGASSRAVASSGGGLTVNFSGVVGDPVAVARQIRSLLVAQDRRVGGVRV
jgi:phage-related protein